MAAYSQCCLCIWTNIKPWFNYGNLVSSIVPRNIIQYVNITIRLQSINSIRAGSFDSPLITVKQTDSADWFWWDSA